ncbi:MAG: carbohydrate-binding domain-containing protein [Oscillospiraceae bacterium]|nr:carbohydrate-binding domain-containing protein [Oscillospiraceae bacterium]
MKKKWIAAFCAAAVLCAATVPALAETNTNNSTTTAPQQQMGGPMGQMGQMGRGGPGGQMGQMPGGNGQMNGQMPSGEMPQMGEMPSGEMPQMNGQMPGGMGGQMGGMMGGQMGGMGQYTTADSPSEVVSGETTNSAADLTVNRAAATKITVSDTNSDIKITQSGTYLITGKAADGNITVKKGVTGVVLILEDLDLTSTTGATLSINKESQVKVVISGTVTLTDNENPDDEESTDAAVADAFDGAAIKVKAGADCVITGNGKLTVNGNAKNGIKSGDETVLVIDGPTVTVNATNDGINGNYDVALLSGSVTVSAGDDAIHADRILTLGKDGSGPDVTVTQSTEGLEGTVVNLAGGTVTINASDDAINAANSDDLFANTLTYAINVTGAAVTINSRGDGLDSNGDINLISGSAVINSAYNGGEAGIDFVGSYYVSDDFDLTNNGGVAFDAGMGAMGGMNGQMGQNGPDRQEGQEGQMGQNAPVDTTSQAQPNFFQRIANWFSNLFSKK